MAVLSRSLNTESLQLLENVPAIALRIGIRWANVFQSIQVSMNWVSSNQEQRKKLFSILDMFIVMYNISRLAIDILQYCVTFCWVTFMQSYDKMTNVVDMSDLEF